MVTGPAAERRLPKWRCVINSCDGITESKGCLKFFRVKREASRFGERLLSYRMHHSTQVHYSKKFRNGGFPCRCITKNRVLESNPPHAERQTPRFAHFRVATELSPRAKRLPLPATFTAAPDLSTWRIVAFAEGSISINRRCTLPKELVDWMIFIGKSMIARCRLQK